MQFHNRVWTAEHAHPNWKLFQVKGAFITSCRKHIYKTNHLKTHWIHHHKYYITVYFLYFRYTFFSYAGRILNSKINFLWWICFFNHFLNQTRKSLCHNWTLLKYDSLNAFDATELINICISKLSDVMHVSNLNTML